MVTGLSWVRGSCERVRGPILPVLLGLSAQASSLQGLSLSFPTQEMKQPPETHTWNSPVFPAEAENPTRQDEVMNGTSSSLFGCPLSPCSVFDDMEGVAATL